MTSPLIEKACSVAFTAATDRVTKFAQINQLIEKLESKRGEAGIEELKVFIIHQAARAVLTKKTAKELLKAVDEIEKKSEPDQAYSNIREFLLYLKQLFKAFDEFESLQRQSENAKFDQLIKNFITLEEAPENQQRRRF